MFILKLILLSLLFSKDPSKAYTIGLPYIPPNTTLYPVLSLSLSQSYSLSIQSHYGECRFNIRVQSVIDFNL